MPVPSYPRPPRAEDPVVWRRKPGPFGKGAWLRLRADGPPEEAPPPGLARGDLGDLFALSGPVADAFAPNYPRDVARVETLLADAGIHTPLPRGSTGLYSFLLDESVRRFQTAQGLDADGRVEPGGPTLARLRAVTGGGGKDGGEPASRQVAQAAPGVTARSKPAKPVTGDPFREAIAGEESRTAGHGAGPGYLAVNRVEPSNVALGRYQLTVKGLKQIGAIMADGTWNPQWGVRSEDEFLNRPDLQERAMDAFLTDAYRQLQKSGTFAEIGQRIRGKDGDFTVTRAGLLAAAHRWGAGGTREYLRHQSRTGWKTDFSRLDKKTAEKYDAIEGRLRNFEDLALPGSLSNPKPKPAEPTRP